MTIDLNDFENYVVLGDLLKEKFGTVLGPTKFKETKWVHWITFTIPLSSNFDDTNTGDVESLLYGNFQQYDIIDIEINLNFNYAILALWSGEKRHSFFRIENIEKMELSHFFNEVVSKTERLIKVYKELILKEYFKKILKEIDTKDYDGWSVFADFLREKLGRDIVEAIPDKATSFDYVDFVIPLTEKYNYEKMKNVRQVYGRPFNNDHFILLTINIDTGYVDFYLYVFDKNATNIASTSKFESFLIDEKDNTNFVWDSILSRLKHIIKIYNKNYT